MKYFSKPTTLVFLFLFFFYLGAAVYYYFISLESKKEKIYIQLSHTLTNELNNEKRFLQEIGIVNAISMAENQDIKDALKNDDRKSAIKVLKKMSKDFARSTNIKDLKVHIHTQDVCSFVRNWKLNKFGDDLSGFRKAIVRVKITKEPFFGFEAGRMGLTLRSIVPILEKDKYLGSLEFIQSFENIIKVFKRKNYSYLLLINDSLMNIAKYLKDAPRVGAYVVSSVHYNSEFVNASKTIDFKKLQHDGYLLQDKYFYAYEEIKDIENQPAGMHLLAMKSQKVAQEIQNSKKALIKSIFINSLFILLLLGVMALLFVLVSSARKRA